METSGIVQAAVLRKATALTEAEAKRLLAEYGVPVVDEAVVHTSREAVTRAETFGFPVVLKGLGARLTHKSERGLVALDLRSAFEVADAFARVRDAAGEDGEGCLIQKMVAGRREFVAGCFRDPQFGPVVMFGLGGIFAEALGDVVFRMAPLDSVDVACMTTALSASALLGDFRGERAAEMEQLEQTLFGLSNLIVRHPEIREIDINPLIVTPEGHIVAVDALVALDAEPQSSSARPDGGAPDVRDRVVQAAIARMVRPRSIAVVGVKRPGGRALVGTDLFKQLQDFGYPGRLYPINPRAAGQSIHGHPAYARLQDLPEVPDLVIVCVPARFVPDALADCAAVGCRNIHVFAAGFKETGEPEGAALQAKIESIAETGGLHVIGPNCMGFYVPEAGMVTWPNPPTESGPVGLISQSGGHSRDFTKFASTRFGIHFSKVVSYGNALTLGGTDFLKFMATDEKTRIILIYLEGIDDGREFFETVRRTSPDKPVIVFKAGMTAAGVRTAASHTGALAGSERIWRTFFEQSGAVRATSLEEMADLTQAFLHLPACKGRRVAVLGSGGGISVNAADACADAGLDLPAFSWELFAALDDSLSHSGTIVSNPIDAHRLFFDLSLLGRLLDRLAGGDEVDMFIVFLHLDWLYTDGGRSQAFMENVADYIGRQGKAAAGGKPLVVACRQYLDIPEVGQAAGRMRTILLGSGVPVFDSMPAAVTTLAKLADYHEWR